MRSDEAEAWIAATSDVWTSSQLVPSTATGTSGCAVTREPERRTDPSSGEASAAMTVGEKSVGRSKRRVAASTSSSALSGAISKRVTTGRYSQRRSTARACSSIRVPLAERDRKPGYPMS